MLFGPYSSCRRRLPSIKPKKLWLTHRRDESGLLCLPLSAVGDGLLQASLESYIKDEAETHSKIHQTYKARPAIANHPAPYVLLAFSDLKPLSAQCWCVGASMSLQPDPTSTELLFIRKELGELKTEHANAEKEYAEQEREYLAKVCIQSLREVMPYFVFALSSPYKPLESVAR